MSAATINRRSVVGGAGLVVVAGGLCAAGAARATAPGASVSPRLARLIALHDRVAAECERFDVEVELPARAACHAAFKDIPKEAPPPHEESATSFVNAFGETRRLSTDTIAIGTLSRRVLNDPTWADIGDDDWRRAHREIAAACDRRDAVLEEQAARLKARMDEIRDRFRIDALADRSESLGDRQWRLWQAAVKFPADGIGDVVAKLAFVERTTDENDLADFVLPAIAGDIRSIAAREA